MSLDFGKLNSALLEPSRVSTGARGAGRHFVHLYEDDSSLVVTAETFLSLGLKFGDAVIVLARPNHAAALGKALVSSGGTSFRDRGVKKAPFVVLIGASMPSILVEIGFISNPKDEALFKKPAYRQRIAERLYKGLSQYAATLSEFQVAKN